MKHLKKLLSIIIVIAMALSLSSCSLFEEDTTITNDTIKIGVLLRGSTENASGTTAACINAIDELTGIDYGIKAERFHYAENIDPNDAEAFNSEIQALINFECNLIIASDPAYFELVKAIADNEENQDVTFIVMGGESYSSNVYGYSADITAPVYLAGIAAGLKAAELRVPLVGFLVEDENNPSLLNAFASGVKSVSDTVKIQAIAGTDAFTNAQKLINAGCVVLASDFDSADMAKVADDGRIFFCGFGSDNYAEYTNSFLCAPIYTFTQYYINTISALINETDIPEMNSGYAQGATSLSDINERTVAAGTADAINSAAKELIQGNLSINTATAENVTLIK